MSKINLDELLQNMLDALDVVIRRGDDQERERGEQLETNILATFDLIVADIAEARQTGTAIPMQNLMAFETLRQDVLELGGKVYQKFID
jgi:hypothetical protein